MMMTAVQASAQTYDLFNGGHEDAPIGFTVGYVNKTWRTNFDDGVFHENPWGDENKRLHGMQFGVVYQPCFPIGFGACHYMQCGDFHCPETAPSVSMAVWLSTGPCMAATTTISGPSDQIWSPNRLPCQGGIKSMVTVRSLTT